mgnify:CR=1 FL=1
MSINNLNTYLNIKDSHLRVVSGNVYAQAMNIGGINIETAHGLQSVSNTGNVTSNTLQFSNAITGFVTTANAQIGRDLIVSGNATVSTDLTVSANATVADTLTISEHLIASKEATVTGNLHVTTIRSDSNVVAEYTGPHDRPLREYPEITMTAATTGGYTVGASSTLTGKDSWEVFGGADYWRSLDAYSTSDPYDYTGVEDITDTNGTLHEGEWLKLEVPNKINISRVTFSFHSTGNFQPTSYVILGSNNDTSWTLIHTNENVSPGLSPSYLSEDNFTTVGYFKYIKLLVKNLNGSSQSVIIRELAYYGHEEGSGSLDTTLKSVYNVPATTGTQLEVYYDAKDLTAMPATVTDLAGGDQNGAVTGATLDETGGIESFNFDGNDYISTTVTGLTGSSVTMSIWVNVNSIDTSRINSIVGLGTYDTGTAGSSTWIAIDGSQRFYTGLVGSSQTVENTSAFTNNWVHLTVIAGTTELSLYQDGLLIGKVNGGTFNLGSNPVLYLGTRSDGSGNPESTRHFNGSIANFRLYSKALNADQVKELYDYQKDYFLGSKSQVTLYKGHLGVGVTEPSGQLELAGDERIQEYPPRDLGGFETMIEGEGTYKVSSSSDVKNPDLGDGTTSGTTTDHPAIAFTANGTFFRGVVNKYDVTSVPAPYIGTHFTNGIGGDFIQIELPHKIYLKSINITTRTNLSIYYDRGPHTGSIFGSNDGGTTWSQVASWTGLNWTLGEHKPIQINSNTLYSTYRLVASELQNTVAAGASRLNIDRWRLFGTPGPTTLDKGSLTLGRSLDVPRISRYDVDTETPRPEKLVVDFDTTVNSSPTDISGRGNHGVFKGNAVYSAADKAFKFDGGGSTYIYKSGASGFPSGNAIYSIVGWVNIEPSISVTSSLLTFGSQWGVSTIGTLSINTSYGFQGSIGGDAVKSPDGVLTPNTWHHLAAVKITSSGVCTVDTYDLYLDGVLITNKTYSGSNRTQNIGTGTKYLAVGGGFTGAASDACKGLISNPKLYSVALEPSEVRKLYNLGRTGRSMVISDTAVGIGKVPEAQLDVRGNLRVGGTIQVPLIITHRYITADTTVTNSNYIPFSGIIYENPTGLYNGNYFVCPIKGIYECVANLLIDNGGSYDGNHTWLVNGSETSPTTRGYATQANGNRHKTGTSHYYLELNSGDAIGLGGVSTIVWYGSPSHRHSHMSIRLITPT